MDATALRLVQAPLKERYRADPEAAQVPLSASGDFRDDRITCTVDGWGGPVRSGLHRATGGDGSDACSGDLLLEALVACAGVTFRSVATAYGVEVGEARVAAASTFDARGTLGLDRSVPVGLGPIDLVVEVDTTVDDETLDKLARATERYCVVGQSLAVPPTITVRRQPGSRP